MKCSHFDSYLMPSGLFTTFFILADHLPSYADHDHRNRIVLALCCCSWCFSMLFPCHAGFKYLTIPTLIHLSTQPSTTKEDGCFSHLVWFPKKAWSVQSNVLMFVSVLPHSNNFFSLIRELIHQIWWNNKYLKPSKFLQCLWGGKKRKEHIFSIPNCWELGKCWSLRLRLIRYQRIYTRRNSKHRPRAVGPR